MISTSSSAPGASNCLRSKAYRVAMSSATLAAAPALPPTVTRPPNQGAQHREEPAALILDRAEGIRAVLCDVGVLVQQVLAR